ncbi:MAG: nucleotidyltransferase domain-containing protein [Bacteroidales bacterium]
MDKNDAVRLSKNYLKRLKKSNVCFSEAWLFGSYAKGNQHDDSDIDIAIVLEDGNSNSFDTEVQLMTVRRGEETRIEPHAFTKEEFSLNIPIVKQILDHGLRII